MYLRNNHNSTKTVDTFCTWHTMDETKRNGENKRREPRSSGKSRGVERSKRGRKEGKKRKRKTRRGGQDGKINSMYRERADVDGVESGRI